MSLNYSQTFTTFVSSTLDERRPEIINAVFKKTPIMAWAASHRRAQQGGRHVFLNYEYGKNTSIKKGVGRGTKVDLVQDEIITDAYWPWTSYAGGLIRYRDDELENSGKYAVFNQMQAYMRNLENTFSETMEEDLLGTEFTGHNSFCGLRGLIEDIDVAWDDTDNPGTKAATPSTRTIGNLSRGTYGWWCNYGYNMTGKDTSQWLTKYLRDAIDGVETWARGGVETMITHKQVVNYYEDEVGETLRTTDVKLGDIGIKAVEYKGIPFLTSPYATTSRIFVVGRDTVEMVYEPRMWFKATDWKEPTQQPFDKAKQVVAKGQFIIKNPKGTAVVYGIGL